MSRHESGLYAGFDSQAASIRRSKDLINWAAERNRILAAGLDPDMVDRNSTPDLFRIQAMIRAGINWPRPIRAGELTKNYKEYLGWPLAGNMVAYAWSSGSNARLAVLRPFWAKVAKEGYRLMLKGIVLQDSTKQVAAINDATHAERQEDIVWGKEDIPTAITWEASRVHDKTYLQEMELGDIDNIQGLTIAVTGGVLRLTDKYTMAVVKVPEDPFVFIRASKRLKRERIISTVLQRARI